MVEWAEGWRQPRRAGRLLEYAKTLCFGPPDKTCRVFAGPGGANLVDHTGRTDLQLVRLMKGINHLYDLTDCRVPVMVTVAELGTMDEFIRLGQMTLGELGSAPITISPRVFRLKYDHPLYVTDVLRVSTALFVLAHEWGHGSDDRREKNITTQYAAAPKRGGKFLSRIELEDYADSFADWYLSRGRTPSYMAQYYARLNNWRKEW